MGNALQGHVSSIPRDNKHGIIIFLVIKEGFQPSFFFKVMEIVQV